MLDVEKLYSDIGAQIKEARLKKGIRQEVLADYLQLSRASIVNIECGRQRPSVHLLLDISHALGIKYTDLIPITAVDTPQETLQRYIQKIVTDHKADDKSAKETITGFLNSLKK